MKKLSRIVSVALITWFLLFDQQITIRAADLDEEYGDDRPDEQLTITTAAVGIDGILGENIITTNAPIENTGVVQNLSEIHSNNEIPQSSDDDVVELNVGGQRITTLRSTLTVVPNSKLALMFAKTNHSDRTMPMDKQGAAFFDYNPAHFNYLLDQLRAISRMPKEPAYEINIQAPNMNVPSNFSHMIIDLGLNPDRFLSPLEGAHLNVNVSSLIGWKECYRSRYDKPFDASIFIKTCKSQRLLVACRSVVNRKTLALVGVGKRSDMFRPCSETRSCITEIKSGTGFYYVVNQAWGFEGRPKIVVVNHNGYNYNYLDGSHNSFGLNPCDSSDHFSEFRLCWSIRSSINRGGGDRCGSMKNLHNATEWERLIYEAV